MTITTARRVLFIGLLLILPVPFYSGHWALLPVANEIPIALHLLIAELNSANGLLLLQGLSGILICWLLAFAYGFWSADWPFSIRGSITGLLVLTALIIFSSVEIYRSLETASQPLTFMQLY